MNAMKSGMCGKSRLAVSLVLMVVGCVLASAVGGCAFSESCARYYEPVYVRDHNYSVQYYAQSGSGWYNGGHRGWCR